MDALLARLPTPATAFAALLALGLLWAWARRSGGPSDRARRQLRAVKGSRWEAVALLNREEARLLPVIERAARSVGRGHRVMAQTSLGEVIRPVGGDAEAFAAVNSKRLDFCVVDASGMPACAVEYHGAGHWGPGARGRDAVKREALRRAGVPLVEVGPELAEAELERLVRAALGARRQGVSGRSLAASGAA